MKAIYTLNNNSFSNYESWLDLPVVTILEMLDVAAWYADEVRKKQR